MFFPLVIVLFSFQYPPSTAPAQHLFVHIGGTVTYADPLLEVSTENYLLRIFPSKLINI